MSRAQRRASRPTASRSRRTPVRPQKSSGLEIPWVPIAVVFGIIAVVGVVAYLVWQTGKPQGPQYAKAQAIERDPAPDLPGQWVDLPTAWGDGTNQAAYANDNGPNTNAHVDREVDYSKEVSANSDTGLPPVGGPHWGSTTCGPDPTNAPAFCGPATFGIYRAPWNAETLVHNMEHGGVVVWYNTSDTSVRDQIENWVNDEFDKNRLVIMTPYPDLPADTIALTAWSRRDVFPVSELTEDRVKSFIDTLACHFNPEHVPCG